MGKFSKIVTCIKSFDYQRFFESIGMEWQYLLWSPQFPWRFKAGRSTKFDARIKCIAQTMSDAAGYPVKIYPMIKMPLFWAGTNERVIHGCVLWRPASMPEGSGYTEWSWGINVYCMLLAYILLWGFFPDFKGAAIILLVLPLPFDFALITVLLALIQYSFVGTIIYALIKLIF